MAAGRELRERGQRSHFVQVEFVDLLAVVELRRRGDAVGAVAEERLVQVQLEDLVLAQLALHLHRQQHFGELAGVGDLGAEEELARDLLGDGRPAGHAFLRSEEHTSELQSLMRISYAVFWLKKNNTTKTENMR